MEQEWAACSSDYPLLKIIFKVFQQFSWSSKVNDTELVTKNHLDLINNKLKDIELEVCYFTNK